MNKKQLIHQTVLFALLIPAMAAAAPTSNGLPIESAIDEALKIVMYIGYGLLIGGVVAVGVKMATSSGEVGRGAAGLALGGGFIVGAKELVEFVFSGTSGLLL